MTETRKAPRDAETADEFVELMQASRHQTAAEDLSNLLNNVEAGLVAGLRLAVRGAFDDDGFLLLAKRIEQGMRALDCVRDDQADGRLVPVVTEYSADELRSIAEAGGLTRIGEAS